MSVSVSRRSYRMKLLDSTQAEDTSFIGGRPRLPPTLALPLCSLCGSLQTFFFQLAFPFGHRWSELSLAVFACTSCADSDYLIPEMIHGERRGYTIPSGFLDSYQRNFRFIVFETKDGVLREDCKERVKFKKIALEHVDDPSFIGHKIGGQPNWLEDDESPAAYQSEPMHFLLQFLEEYKFELVPDAPGQKLVSYMPGVEETRNDHYLLFLANNLYFFGTENRHNPKVYVITQI